MTFEKEQAGDIEFIKKGGRMYIHYQTYILKSLV
jgi:hypothetical protein